MADLPQRNFTGGELDPALHARADLTKYRTGLATLRNMKIQTQGGVSNREGLEFIFETKDSAAGLDKEARLIPFEFNKQQAYILEFGDLYMRVYKDGGAVLEATDAITGITNANPAVVSVVNSLSNGDEVFIDGVAGMTEVNGNRYIVANRTAGTIELAGLNSTAFGAWTAGGTVARIFTLVTPWAEADLPLLKYTQSADVLTVTHADYDIQRISRSAHDNWSISTPTYDAINAAMTLSSVVAGGGGAGANTKDYRYLVAYEDFTTGQESLPSNQITVNTGSLSETHFNDITYVLPGASPVPPHTYLIYKAESETSNVFGLIGTSKTATFRDYNLAPDMSIQPKDTPKNPFLSSLVDPATTAYYQQRQWFGRTNFSIQTIYATDAGDFDHFTQSKPITSADSIEATIAGQKVNEIRHFIELNSLLVLTSGGEWVVTEGQEGVVTPATIGFRRQTAYGAEHVRPVVIGNSALYVQIGGKTIRDLAYSFQSDSYGGNDITLLAQHLFVDSTVKEMAYALEPDGIAWVVMADGSLRGLTFQKEHAVFGWHKHDTEGTFESVASIPEDNFDAVYFIVKRTINGATKRYVERMKYRTWLVAEDAFIVDSGLTYDGAPATIISGLEHLEGEAVAVLADGNVVNGLSVSGGSITLATAASKVHIGLPYTSDFETLDVDPNLSVIQQETYRGNPLNIGECIIKVQKTRGGLIGPDATKLNDLPSRNVGDSYDPIALRTTEYRVPIEEDWSSNGRLFIRQSDPLPITILAVIPDVDVG